MALNGSDQFVLNIFLLQGEMHQILRDIGLMLPDVLHVILSVIEYQKDHHIGISLARDCKIEKSQDQVKTKDALAFFLSVLLLWFIGARL